MAEDDPVDRKAMVEAAYSQGANAAQVTGQESQSVCNPYAGEDGAEDLYEAWEGGFEDASDIYGEMIHFGV